MNTVAPEPVAKTKTVILIGNPNTGKTTLFNHLTGEHERVANYTGITVAESQSRMRIDEQDMKLVDLPGCYSLSTLSKDEAVVFDYFQSRTGNAHPNLVVCVAEATNLERNLVLAAQVAEIGLPMMIVINQMDMAEKAGIQIDFEALEQRLGVPVIPCTALDNKAVDKVRNAIKSAIDTPRTMQRTEWPESIREPLARLHTILEGKIDTTDPVAISITAQRLLFDGKKSISNYIKNVDDIEAELTKAKKEVMDAGLNPSSVEIVLHHKHLSTTLEGMVQHKGVTKPEMTEKLDRWLTDPIFGIVFFIGMMFIVFQAVYAWAVPLMDLIDGATGIVQGWIAPMLVEMPMLQSLVVDGVIGGVGGVIIFLPQILILFFFIGLLEDTGYMARAALIMDKYLGWCGLNGKSFVPLLSSFACAIPGVMATRTIPDKKARLGSILIAPLMSCSARLPVYLLMIGAFIAPLYGAQIAGITLFAMHFLGLALALPIAFIINKFILKVEKQPFILELTPYRRPKLDNLFWRVAESGREFLIRAGSVILAFSIIIWALAYFPRDEKVEIAATQQFIEETAAANGSTIEAVQQDIESGVNEDLNATLDAHVEAAYIEQSLLGKFGKGIQPIFDPAGFDWKTTVGVVASFPAREVIISTLGIIYSLGGDVDEESDSLRETMAASTWTEGARAGQPVFTIPVVAAIMVFFALCMQCGATVATIAQETSWKWAVFSFAYMTALAWVGAVLTYQIGTALMA